MRTPSVPLRICAAILLAFGLASLGAAQNREKFGISAKAGGVNSITGRVLVRRAGQTSQPDLTDRDDLSSGDVVTTLIGSRVEVLLNPGTYLRVAEQSEFELIDNSLNSLRVKLIKGSAIVEATGSDDTELRIGIATEQSQFVIVRRGVYRFNVGAGSAELLVQKGRVMIDGQAAVIKGVTKVTFNGPTSVVAKLDKKDRDELDHWSKDRAEFLALANQKLSIGMVNSYLSNWDWDSGFFGSRFGFWAFSPFSRCFTFFPFSYGWASPYGGNYWRSGWLAYGYNYGCCQGGNFDPLCCRGRVNPPIIVSNPPYGSPGGYGGSSGGGFGGSGSGSGGGSSGGGSGGSPSGGSSAPPPRPPSPAGPRDPDSGVRINRIKDPIN